jgi:tRNA 2-thiouridine synthesizing protein A
MFRPAHDQTMKNIERPADRRVDARGLLCPLPTVKTALALEEMAVGQILEVFADDPATRTDLPAWCRENGHFVPEIRQAGRHFCVRVTKGEKK